VRRVLRGAGDGRRTQHRVGEADRPLIGLLGSHGASDDEREALDPEMLAQQSLLGDDVVTDANGGNLDIAISALAPLALWGEVDRPLPIWLTATMKYRSGLRRVLGPT
jgi:hypothetical protein